MNIDHETRPGGSDPNTLKDVVEWHNARSDQSPPFFSFRKAGMRRARNRKFRDDRRSILWSPSAKRFAVIIESRQCLSFLKALRRRLIFADSRSIDA
jgi:hypothetical protein